MPENVAICPAEALICPPTMSPATSRVSEDNRPFARHYPPRPPRLKSSNPNRLRRPADPELRRRHVTLLKELRLAEQVQRSMLPRVLPNLPTLEFGASLRPSQHLAGDFYNVIRLDQDRVGFYLGDVMGHGPAAALLGVFAMQGLRTKRIEGSSYEILSPAAVLTGLSRDLIHADFYESPFVTMIYAVLDTTNNSLVYSCGGHPPAILMREGEAPSLLNCRSPLLGVFDVPFEQAQITLKLGDRVAMFSDGVESMNWGDFGEGVDGLIKALEVRDGRSPQLLIDEAMAMAEPGAGPADDLTVVMVEMR